MTMLPPDPVFIFRGRMEPVFCVTFKQINEKVLLYAGTQTGNVHIWDLKTNREITNFESSKESCLSVIPVNDELDVTQDKMGVVKLWTIKNMEWILKTKIETDYYGFCHCQVYQNMIYMPLKKGCIESVCVQTPETKRDSHNFVQNRENNEIMCFKVTNVGDETVILIAFESCDLRLFNFGDCKDLGGLKLDECPMALDYHAATMTGVCGCPTENLLVFTVSKTFDVKVRQNVVLKNPGVASVAIRPDGRLMAVGCWDGKVRLYSMKSLSILAALDVHSSTIQDVAFFGVEDDNGVKQKFLLAACSKDKKVSLWDLYNK